jgi:diguanylate cyclase (GGDEF)-like protein
MAASSLRLLLVEDDPAYAELTRAMLRTTSDVTITMDHTTSVHAAVEKLADASYDIVLLDLGLPDAVELEALSSLVGAAPDLPLVIVTGTENEGLALQAVKGGAQDYLIKGQATPELLLRAIRYAIERKQSELHIRHLAYYDPLTQLPNRRLLIEHLGHALKRAERTGGIVGVFFIDVDKFKQINDGFGHATGDSVLTELSSRLSKALRSSDTLGRLSGDEFVAVVEAGEARELALVATALRRSVKTPFTTAHGELFATLSIGVSSFPADGEEVSELLRNADHAMYRAKSQGRDAVCFFAAPVEASRSFPPTFTSALRRAAERDELRVHFQPLVNLHSGVVDGLEALVRWQHPSRGIIPPGDFIHLAEESDLILSIERWVLHTAMTETAKHPSAKSLRLAVNVSRRHFDNPALVRRLSGLVGDIGYDFRLLELELSESGIMHHPDRVLDHLKACRDLGMTITVDDFGTGYSCLGLMKDFPLTALKIDQSFVRNCGLDPVNGALCNAVISMGHALGLEVTAEGVETEAELTYLCKQNCDRAQGWYFGKPVPSSQLSESLAQANSEIEHDKNGASHFRSRISTTPPPHALLGRGDADEHLSHGERLS